MGKIVVNDRGEQLLAGRQLIRQKILAAIVTLDSFIDNTSPSNAEILAQVKFQARLLKKILNNIKQV